MPRRPSLVAITLLVAACSGTPPSPPFSSTSPNASAEASAAGLTPGPTVDAALVESHEAACQAYDAAYVAEGGTSWVAGLERIAVLQTFDHAVHLYAEQGPRFAICYQSSPGQVNFGGDVWADIPAQGYVTPQVRFVVGQYGWVMEMGLVDPLVDRVSVEIAEVGPTWGSVGGGRFLIQWPFDGEEAPDPLGGYQGYDSCGNPLRDITLGGEPTPCPPGG
jgi:hypothetical protein